jgi:hypothetical protein
MTAIVAIALIAAVSIGLTVLIVRVFPNSVGREPSWVVDVISGRAFPFLRWFLFAFVATGVIVAALGLHLQS